MCWFTYKETIKKSLIGNIVIKNNLELYWNTFEFIYIKLQPISEVVYLDHLMRKNNKNNDNNNANDK